MRKVGSSYRGWANSSTGISQRSFLSFLLLNIFVNDIFLFIEKSDKWSFPDEKAVCYIEIISKFFENFTK